MHKAVKSAGVEASTLITSVSADTGSLSIRKICCARSKVSKSSTGLIWGGRSQNCQNHQQVDLRRKITKSSRLVFMIYLSAKDQTFQQLLSDRELRWNISKGTTDPRVEFISQFLTQILIKIHFQNLDQASTSKSQPNISIPTKL